MHVQQLGVGRESGALVEDHVVVVVQLKGEGADVDVGVAGAVDGVHPRREAVDGGDVVAAIAGLEGEAMPVGGCGQGAESAGVVGGVAVAETVGDGA